MCRKWDNILRFRVFYEDFDNTLRKYEGYLEGKLHRAVASGNAQWVSVLYVQKKYQAGGGWYGYGLDSFTECRNPNEPQTIDHS